jgi:hypothetical protein
MFLLCRKHVTEEEKIDKAYPITKTGKKKVSFVKKFSSSHLSF